MEQYILKLITKQQGILRDFKNIDDEYDEEIEYLEEEYRKEMAEEILTWLRDEYEYLQIDEAVSKTLIANDYEFTEEGEIY